jgi:hypothetical protein
MMTTDPRSFLQRWVIVGFSCAMIAVGACSASRGPVIGSGEKTPDSGGTISGIVRASGSNAPLSARRVTATEVTTGATFDASTATNGGYTMKVPMGRYRLEVELRAGEMVVDRPAETTINRSDLDAQRDFLIGLKSPA